MKEAFDRDPYSWSFNAMRLAGQWTEAPGCSPGKKLLWRTYRTASLGYGFFITAIGFVDLYDCRTDFKKAAFNMCTTILTLAVWAKNLQFMIVGERFDRLRFDLFKSSRDLADPEDVSIKDFYVNILFKLRRVFFVGFLSAQIVWCGSSLASLKWGPRELPFPVWMPLDLDNNYKFTLGFLCHFVGSVYIITSVAHGNLGLFSILLQITALSEVLARKILKINEMYQENARPDTASETPEINPVLVNRNTKLMLRDCFLRHLKLKEYTRELEFCYNKPMMVQIACGFLLTIVIGLELMVESVNFSFKFFYQLAYTALVIMDIFLFCTFSELLMTQCEKVQSSLYNLPWYDMDGDVKKELLLIITAAQRVLQLTAGKTFRLRFTMFLEVVLGGPELAELTRKKQRMDSEILTRSLRLRPQEKLNDMMNHIYGWLVFLRQLVMKK